MRIGCADVGRELADLLIIIVTFHLLG